MSLKSHFAPICIVSDDDDDDLISEVIYSEGGAVSYAVKCNVSENCAAVGVEEEASLGSQSITAVGKEIITVEGLKTYLQLESVPRIQITEDASHVLSEHEKDPSANGGIRIFAGSLVEASGIETERGKCDSSWESDTTANPVTFEISAPVSPAPIQTPMPLQGCLFVNI